MKFKSKRFKKYRSLVILYTVFSILFPYNLMADDSNYKVPKKSLSYFVEDTNENQVEIVSPPTKVADKNNTATKPDTSAKKAPEPIVKEKTAPEPYISKKTISRQTNKDEHFELSWPDSQKNIKSTKTPASKPRKVVKKPKELSKTAATKKHHKEQVKKPVKKTTKKELSKTATAKRHYKEQVKKPAKKTIKKDITPKAPAKQVLATNTSEEEPVFSEALKRMQQRAAERRAEAEKLGIVLPSQGGDMASVSPALSKINKTVKSILSRNP
ncbi:MAG: hypothetical protein ACQETH_04905 [Candidatus Rifleibacteriota bacterium]